METHTARLVAASAWNTEWVGAREWPARIVAQRHQVGCSRIVQWQRQRRDILELQRMDDRLLADIGITRGEVEHMVRNGRWSQASFEPERPFRRPAASVPRS